MPSSNPLWFGYYPGDRPVMKRGQAPQQIPIGMPDMGLEAVLDEAVNVLQAPVEMPKQLWTWITEDWKTQFKIAASPYKQTGDDLYSFDTEEVADVQGAYITINLVDLVKNPKKTAEKFVQSSVNLINPLKAEFWTDLDTSREKTMWRTMLTYTPGAASGPIYTEYLLDSFASGSGRMRLKGNGIFKASEAELTSGVISAGGMLSTTASVAEGVDVYDKVGESVMNFVAGKKSAFNRTETYSNMQRSFIDAAAVELKQKRGVIDASLAGSPLSFSRMSQIDTFVSENSLIGNLQDFDKTLSGRGGMKDILSKQGFTGGVPVASIQGKMTYLNQQVADIQTNISAIRGTLTGAELAGFNSSIKEMEGVLGDMGSLCSRYTGGAMTSMSRLESEKLLSELTSLSSRFSNTRYSGGAYDRFLQSVSRRYFEGPNSLLHFDPSDAAGTILSDGFRSLDTLHSYQKGVYLREDGADLLKAILSDKGEFAKSYLYIGQVKDRIQMFTPAYWTGKIISRTHGFGLVYDSKATALHPIFERNPLLRTNSFKETFSVNLGLGSVNVSGKFKGGEHLETFYNAWTREQAGRLVGTSVGGVVDFGSTNPAMQALQNRQALFDAINGNHLNVSALGPGMNYVVGSTKQMESIVGDWSEFRNALSSSGLPFAFDASGNLLNTNQNKDLLDGLFKSIGQRKMSAAQINPFMRKVGGLQIYASKLTVVQQKIYSKIGKFADPFIQMRTAISRRVSAFIAKAIAKLAVKAGIAALGVATGGIATALAPVIEKIVQMTISKISDVAKSAFKAVIKGDFVAEFDKMMEEALKTTEKAITCGCIVPMIMSLGGLYLMGNIIISISPVDRAKAAIISVISAILPRPPSITASNCVFPSYTITCYSYNTGDHDAVPCRHGSNNYYAPKDDADGDPAYKNPPDGIRDCDFMIPAFGHAPVGGPLADSASWCKGATPRASYFGFAMDLVPSGSRDTTWIVAPALGGVTTWSVSTRPVGCTVSLNGSDGSHTYAVHMTHLDCGNLPTSGTLNPGDPVDLLGPYSGGKHVHIELEVDGVYQRPEDIMCK